MARHGAEQRTQTRWADQRVLRYSITAQARDCCCHLLAVFVTSRDVYCGTAEQRRHETAAAISWLLS